MTEDILFRVSVEVAGGVLELDAGGCYRVMCPNFLSYKISPLVKAFRAKGYDVELVLLYR